MRSLWTTAAFALALLIAALPPAWAQHHGHYMPVGMDSLPLGASAWDLRQLNDDPVRLVKASHDQRTNEVRLVLEFQRSLGLEDIQWTGPRGQSVVVDRDGNVLRLNNPPWSVGPGRPPYLVRFLDEDGVTLLSTHFRYDGDLVGLQGQRVRFVLSWPGKEIESRTKRVTVDKLSAEY
jgi:hypothetical protein